MELIKKYFNLKKEKIYTTYEIFKLCYKGNFVAYTVGTTEEIIHYYKGYFYYNNGLILNNEMTNFYYEHPYIKWYIKYYKEEVNKYMLEKLHKKIKNHYSGLKDDNLFNKCINSNYYPLKLKIKDYIINIKEIIKNKIGGFYLWKKY